MVQKLETVQGWPDIEYETLDIPLIFSKEVLYKTYLSSCSDKEWSVQGSEEVVTAVNIGFFINISFNESVYFFPLGELECTQLNGNMAGC